MAAARRQWPPLLNLARSRPCRRRSSPASSRGRSSRPPLGRSSPTPMETLGRSLPEPSHGGPKLASARSSCISSTGLSSHAELGEDGSRRRQAGGSNSHSRHHRPFFSVAGVVSLVPARPEITGALPWWVGARPRQPAPLPGRGRADAPTRRRDDGRGRSQRRR
jgi:hypothetical protein